MSLWRTFPPPSQETIARDRTPGRDDSYDTGDSQEMIVPISSLEEDSSPSDVKGVRSDCGTSEAAARMRPDASCKWFELRVSSKFEQCYQSYLLLALLCTRGAGGQRDRLGVCVYVCIGLKMNLH